MFYQYLYKESTFGDQMRTWGTAILVCSLPMKSKKRQAHDVFDIFFPHLSIPVLFRTSLIQTAGHKKLMVALMVIIIFTTSKHLFSTKRMRNQDKTAVCIFCIQFLSIKLLQFGSFVFLILQWKVTMFLLLLKHHVREMWRISSCGKLHNMKCFYESLVVNCTTWNVFMNLFL